MGQNNQHLKKKKSHLVFRGVNTIQKVCRPVSGCVQLQWGRRDETILHRHK